MDFEKLRELVTELFQDPKAALYQAREPENQNEVLALAVMGIAIAALGQVGSAGLVGAIVGTLLGFLFYVVALWVGGRITGGSGTFTDMLRLCGFVYLPLGVASAVLGFVKLGILATVFGWIVGYYLMLVGHGFSGFRDVVFAYVIALVVQFLSIGAIAAALVALH